MRRRVKRENGKRRKLNPWRYSTKPVGYRQHWRQAGALRNAYEQVYTLSFFLTHSHTQHSVCLNPHSCTHWDQYVLFKQFHSFTFPCLFKPLFLQTHRKKKKKTQNSNTMRSRSPTSLINGSVWSCTCAIQFVWEREEPDRAANWQTPPKARAVNQRCADRCGKQGLGHALVRMWQKWAAWGKIKRHLRRHIQLHMVFIYPFGDHQSV